MQVNQLGTVIWTEIVCQWYECFGEHFVVVFRSTLLRTYFWVSGSLELMMLLTWEATKALTCTFWS